MKSSVVRFKSARLMFESSRDTTTVTFKTRRLINVLTAVVATLFLATAFLFTYDTLDLAYTMWKQSISYPQGSFLAYLVRDVNGKAALVGFIVALISSIFLLTSAWNIVDQERIAFCPENGIILTRIRFGVQSHIEPNREDLVLGYGIVLPSYLRAKYHPKYDIFLGAGKTCYVLNSFHNDEDAQKYLAEISSMLHISSKGRMRVKYLIPLLIRN